MTGNKPAAGQAPILDLCRSTTQQEVTMSLRKLALLYVLCAAGASVLPAHAQTTPYEITVVGAANSQAWGLNNLGTVVGVAFGPSFDQNHAFVNTGTGPVDLGTLGGTNSIAVAVNDAGQIVGSADNAAGQSRAFLYQNGSMTNLGTFGGDISYGSGINAAGTTVGSAFAPENPNDFSGQRAFVRPPGGTLQDIGTLPGFSSPYAEAFDINNHGQIVGASGQGGPGDPPVHPFLYSNGVMTDLGTFGNAYSAAFAINDAGLIVGYSDSLADFHIPQAFLYANGKLINLDARLGGQGSTAFDINNLGQIVGSSSTLGAFIMQGDKVTSLDALIDPAAGWSIELARAINDRGQIAATGVLNGTAYAVLLTPVPEPAAASMLGLGLGVLAVTRGLRQRRRRGLPTALPGD
jgi:probable HAF family extracellular repeat protein